jgi:hypothetical protein
MQEFVDALELFRAFYYSLGVPLRSVVEYKIRKRGGSLSEVLRDRGYCSTT